MKQSLKLQDHMSFCGLVHAMQSQWPTPQVRRVPTEAMTLFNGGLDFSSTIDAMDSTEDTREWDPKGWFGMRVELGYKKGSGACF